jgi:hypothetical protein
MSNKYNYLSDSTNSIRTLLSDVAHKHTPDSIREQAYRELQEKHGISHAEAQQQADKLFGDYWG